MKSLKLAFILIITGLLTQSFESTTPNYIGTYGVSNNNSSHLKLTIEEDGSFTYKDFTNPKKKINVSGTWNIKNGKITLNSASKINYHNKWKFNKDGTVAKSRKGLLFYTLHKTQ